MTNSDIAKAIKDNDLVAIAQLVETHPRKIQVPMTTKEIQKQLLLMVPKNHPDFWNILADYYYRLTEIK